MGEGVVPPLQKMFLISELKMAHFGAFWLLLFSAQLRLILYLRMVSMSVDETEKLIGAALCKIYSLYPALTWLDS